MADGSSAVVLQQREITGSKEGPRLLIFGGVHGDEFEPMAAIRRLMRLIEPARLRGRITFVPVVNEPAFLRGHRTAEDGLDLARTFPGRPNGSITERVAHAATQLIQSADYFIDLHTGGTTLSVLPLAGYMLLPDAEVLAVQRRMARAFNLPVVWGTDYRMNGRSLSAARDAGVPAIYAEYLGAATCSREGIEAYVAGCLNVLDELGMVAHPRPASRIQWNVEDPRPSSGYLQICNPAPFTGFFDPAVQLGDTVAAGDPLGTLFDVLGDRSEVVPADKSGVVITLSTFSRVTQGAMVAVIMETEEGTGGRG